MAYDHFSASVDFRCATVIDCAVPFQRGTPFDLIHQRLVADTWVRQCLAVDQISDRERFAGEPLFRQSGVEIL